MARKPLELIPGGKADPSEPDDGPRVYRSSELRPGSLEFVWPPYLVAGDFSLVEGLPGTAKTTTLCDLAARMTRGDHHPLSKTRFDPRNVVMVVTEENMELVTIPRLEHMGANMKRVLWIKDPLALEQRSLKLALRGGAALVLETLYHHCTDFEPKEEIPSRRWLAELLALLRSTGSPCLASRHLNKHVSIDIHRGQGAQAWVAQARAALRFDRYHDGTFIARSIKPPSYGPTPPSMTFRVVGPPRSEDPYSVRTSIKWLELVQPDNSGLAPVLARAVAFLRAQFAEQPIWLSKEIKHAMLQAGFTAGTIENAISHLENIGGALVDKIRSHRQGPWLWMSKPEGSRQFRRFEREWLAEQEVNRARLHPPQERD